MWRSDIFTSSAKNKFYDVNQKIKTQTRSVRPHEIEYIYVSIRNLKVLERQKNA